jgi:hypothetical protein
MSTASAGPTEGAIVCVAGAAILCCSRLTSCVLAVRPWSKTASWKLYFSEATVSPRPRANLRLDSIRVDCGLWTTPKGPRMRAASLPRYF